MNKFGDQFIYPKLLPLFTVVMSKIRGDPKQIALAHPTRAQMYHILQKKIGVHGKKRKIFHFHSKME